MLLKIKDKTGGEKIFSGVWLLVWLVVIAGIVIAVTMFHGADVDVRNIEADILYERLIGCVVQQGILEEDVNKDSVFRKCGLNQEVFAGDDGFYFRISVYDENENKVREDIVHGHKDFATQCAIQEKDEEGKETEAEHWAKCVRGVEGVLYYDHELKEGKIEVLAASNNVGRKISIME